MTGDEQRVLSVDEAARVIYNTARPTTDQVNRVRVKLARGALKPSAKGPWSTTSAHVADYLARRALAKRQARHDSASSSDLSGLYRQLLRDYFLAIVARRKVKRRSKAFDRAVILGQIASLSLILATAWFAARSAFPPVLAEHVAIQQWIADDVGPHKIVEWFPGESISADSIRLRVKYLYYSGGRKSILTDRVFVIERGHVTSVQTTD